MKIAVTGVTGFIGTYLLKALAEKYGRSSVIAISSRNLEDFECVTYTDNKLVNAEILCDVLIHAGAYIPKVSSEANNLEKCDSNIFFTESLLLNISAKRCQKIINLSTVDVYESNGIISEETPVNPVSLYGMSKFYCEKMIKAYADQNNIKVLNLRVGHVYGVGEEVYQKILPITIQKIISNSPVEVWGTGEDLRSFIHVEDVVDSILSAIETKVEVNTINVVSGNKISIKELVKTLIEISGKNIKIKHKESNLPQRDLVFDNSLLKKYLLPKERNFILGLRAEYEHNKLLVN